MSSQGPLEILRYGGPARENSYIVKLKPQCLRQSHVEGVSVNLASVDGLSEVTHADWDPDFFHGYAGKFSAASLDALRANPDVEYIEEDVVVTTQELITQTNAPWGLARLSQNDQLVDQTSSSLNFSYTYDSSAGAGVDIYVLDTGIYVGHSDFGGRAKWGITVAPDSVDEDKVGHGTHCAGIAAGTQFGVAKAANLIAVKVLGDKGNGATSDVISGMSWAIDQARQSGRPSVCSMSLGGPKSKAMNDAVVSVTDAGLHLAAAAGNDGKDAKNYSPASAPTAITVGASTINDKRAYFSNHGSSVDIFAPGHEIVSAGLTGPKSIATKSGTSMATPLVAGLIAYLIGRSGNVSPADLAKKLKELSIKDALADIPTGTVNLLSRNDA